MVGSARFELAMTRVRTERNSGRLLRARFRRGFGGLGRFRTFDLRLIKAPLCQLSYETAFKPLPLYFVTLSLSKGEGGKDYDSAGARALRLAQGDNAKAYFTQ